MPKAKVITTMQHRREIEEALLALAGSRTEEEGSPYLRALAARGPAVLPVVMQYLDTPDPWMVRALGRAVAQMEDRARAGAAMRRAILSPASSDRRRIVAMVLLDQFLGQTLDDSLFSALGNPTDVAVAALLGDAVETEPLVRLDYLSIIHAQSLVEVLYALDRFREKGGPGVVEALCFFAMDEREAVARVAIEVLGSIRHPDALRALAVLMPNVPSFRQTWVERMYRKLVLSGVPESPLPDLRAGTRVLVSPLDGAGNRLMLFLFPEDGECQVLHVFLDDRKGIRGSYEVVQPEDELPAPGPTGRVHPAPHPWEGIFLLEGGMAYARRLLTEALERSRSIGNPCPLEYRFFLERIWGWSVSGEASEKLPGTQIELSQELVADFIGHPYFASWFLESEAIREAARGLLQVDLSRQDGQSLLSLATISLVQAEFSAAVCLQHARRLRDTAEWLFRAGEVRLAEVALASAADLENRRPLHSAFALMLMQKGLLFALGSLHREIELQVGPQTDDDE